MTEHEFVRRYFPSASAEEAHALLWECTAYPACSLDHAAEQLAHMAVKAANPKHAVCLAHDEMDLAWEEGRAERESWRALP